jgi:hypothetical protein
VIGNGKSSGTTGRVQEVIRVWSSAYNAPREAIETMHRATAELKATGVEERVLKVGDRAPSFMLFN